MPFDWSSAQEVQAAPVETAPSGQAPSPGSGNGLETKLPFDWSSAKPLGDTDTQAVKRDVEGQNPTLYIHAPEEPKTNFLDALKQTAQDYAARGPSAAGEKIADNLGQTLDFGQEAARKEQIARSQAVYALSEATGTPLHEVDQHFDELVKDPKLTGIKGDFSTPLDALEYGLAISLPFGFLAAPAATIKGVLIFSALDKLIPTEKLIPHDAPRDVKTAIRLVDLIAKGALTSGAYKHASPLLDEAVECFTLNKLQEYKLPTEVKLTAEQVKDIWQTGNLTTAEQKDLFNGLGLKPEQVKSALKSGVTIRVPAQKISRISGKPWFEKVRSIFGQEPVSKTTTDTAGDIVRGLAGLLQDPNMKAIVEGGGGVFVGYQAPTISAKSGKVFGNTVYFNSPKTGSTYVLSLDKFNAENVRTKIAEGNAKFEQATKNETSRMDAADEQKTAEAQSRAASEKFQTEKKTRGTEQAKVNPEDIQAAVKAKLGGMEYVKAIQMPELLKLAKELSDNKVDLKKNVAGSSSVMGGFYHIDFATGFIELKKAIFSDPALAQGVLAHEIGHLVDWLEDKTLLRGNILGRLASVLDYHKSVLPEKPGAPGDLTDKDRARIRKDAERIARERAGGKKDEVSSKIDPDMVISIWNSVEQSGIPPELLDYVKKLLAEEKKALVKSAFEAKKKGEPLTIEDLNKFKKDFDANPEAVSKIYADLIKEEIKKRNLYDLETISNELKALTQWWHPFNPAKAPASYLKYRYDSRELYAEFVSVLLNAPAQAALRVPKTYEAFWNYIGNKPEVLKTLMDTQALIQGSNGELYKQRGEDIKGMFETGEEVFRARQMRYEEAKRSIWFHMKNMFWDKNTSILEKLPEIRKKDNETSITKKTGIVNPVTDEFIDPNSDPKYILEKNDYVAAITKSYVEKLDPVFKEVIDGGLMQDVDLFMFAKRVAGDRAEFANPLGHNPETAAAQLEYMKAENPAKYDQIERIVSQIQDWFKTEINPLMKDIYSPEQMAMVDANENYAPFRVIDFMKDYVSAGIIAQTGTIREIASPFTALVMKATSMVNAATRNEVKKSVSNFMLQHPEQFGMEPAKVTNFFDGERQVFKIENPPDKTKGTISWREGGKWKAYHVDRFIADVFDRGGNNDLMYAGQVIDKLLLNNALFRPLWITFNATFQARNLFRDFFRAWKAHPEMTLGRTLKAYGEAFPHAVAKVKGDYDSLVNEMYKNGAIGVTLNDLILGEASEETELTATLKRYDLLPSKQSKFREIPVLREIIKGLDAVRFAGDVIETIPKVAGWQALSDLPINQKAYIVRNLVGTPNYKRGGTIKPISNSAFLFSNIIKEGYRGMLELATDPDLRAQYWKKTAFVSVLSAVFLWAAQHGVFGKDKQREVEGMTEYDKANYVSIPFGLNEAGETRYLRMVLDEDGRFFHALVWKALNGFENPEKAAKDIFSFGAGQLPSPAPLPGLLSKWGQFLGGQIPRDDFRQRDIVSEERMKAGGWDAFEPMLIWTMNQTGLSGFQVYDRLKDQTIWKKVLGLTPVLQSFWRETNFGQQEKFREVLSQAQREEAKQRLELADQIENNPQAAVAAQTTEKDQNKVRRKIAREEVKKGTDPLARTLVQATSNNQKIAVFTAAFDQFGTSKELEKYLDTATESKLISQNVAASVMQAYEDKKKKAA